MLAHKLLPDTVAEVNKSPYYSIIADGTTDVDGREQFSVSLRYVTDELFQTSALLGFISVLTLLPKLHYFIPTRQGWFLLTATDELSECSVCVLCSG